jgi:hypothetical protein
MPSKLLARAALLADLPDTAGARQCVAAAAAVAAPVLPPLATSVPLPLLDWGKPSVAMLMFSNIIYKIFEFPSWKPCPGAAHGIAQKTKNENANRFDSQVKRCSHCCYGGGT